jgi:tRNA A-37 threonylcarbamoyl transferase component Bud32
VADETLCPRCSATNLKGTGFCGKCGTSLASTMTTEAQPDPLIGAFIGERFLVKRKLGEGGMGVVYEAEQTAIDRKVALKVLHPHLTDESLYARFRNEAAAASRLGHPNTITVFDFGKTETGSLYIAMEFVEGASLDDEIRRCGALEWRRAARIATQICGSLANAHENGIVHRDLKPENVMLLTRGTEKDIVKVLDFGIAKIMEDDGKDQRQALTKTGMVFGTPQYMSPEQIRGEKVDARSDIYSTGVIVYQMLTGALPFNSETPMGLLTKHLMDKPPAFTLTNPANQVPPELERLVMQALAKTAGERPQTMREVAERIDALVASSPATMAASAVGGVARTVPMGASDASGASAAVRPGSSPGASTPPVAGRKRRNTGMIVGIAIGAAVVVLGGGSAAWYFLAGPGRQVPTQPVTQLVVPPQIVPPLVGPLGPGTPPVQNPVQNTGVTDPSLAPLQAIPTDTGSDTSGKNGASKSGKSGGGGSGGVAGKIGGGKKPQLAKCTFGGGEDPIQNAVRDALRPKENGLRLCAQSVAGQSTTRFAYNVAANATKVSGVSPRTSSGLEGCMKPHMMVSIAASDPTLRVGEIRITMWGQAGKDLCDVQVSAQAKAKPPAGGGTTGGGGKTERTRRSAGAVKVKKPQ